MAIPEDRLKVWANQGATEGSKNTYTSIKAALDGYSWPEGMKPDIYLQGSYANSTNTRGNSDVDVVAEMTCVYYSNLTEAEKPRVGWIAGRYSFSDFRVHVVTALRSYYGAALIDESGGKAVRVSAAPGRLNADVLPCVQYKRYDALQVVAEGVTFWNQVNGEQVVNYPKLHIKNGEQKNETERTRVGTSCRYACSRMHDPTSLENLKFFVRDIHRTLWSACCSTFLTTHICLPISTRT